MLTLTGNGRITRDVELRSTPSGESVATVSHQAQPGACVPVTLCLAGSAA